MADIVEVHWRTGWQLMIYKNNQARKIENRFKKWKWLLLNDQCKSDWSNLSDFFPKVMVRLWWDSKLVNPVFYQVQSHTTLCNSNSEKNKHSLKANSANNSCAFACLDWCGSHQMNFGPHPTGLKLLETTCFCQTAFLFYLKMNNHTQEGCWPWTDYETPWPHKRPPTPPT